MSGSSYRPPEWAKTLLGELAMDGCLDELRELNSEFGLYPYRVFLVRTRWSGESRGEGTETVFYEEELLPPPKVDPVSSVNRQLLDIGVDEQGTLQVSEISPRYTEKELLGYNSLGGQIPDNETFYWEVVLMRGDAETKTRRRFLVQGVPSYDAAGLQWTARLTRAGTDREGSGVPG